MNELVTSGFFIVDQYITEKSDWRVVYRIPSDFRITIDEKALKEQFDEIRSIDVGVWSNGDMDIKIYLKQWRPSYDGYIMVYD